MIRQLRKKFIMVAMLSTILVLTFLIGTIQGIYYYEILSDTDGLLKVLAENGGFFPGDAREAGIFEESSGIKRDRVSAGEEIPEDQRPDQTGLRNWTEETPFETRFFSVLLDRDGSVLETDTVHIAAVTPQEAQTIAKEVLESGKTKGFFGNYRYLRTEEEEGIRIIFVDCGRLMDNFKYFFLICTGVSGLGLLLVFVLVFIFSGLVFLPVLKSDEKQKQFITDASHELKTPLTIIDANTEVLEMMGGENEFTQSIRRQIRRLTYLTQQMVTLTRMDEGRKPGPMSEVSFGEIVTEIVDSFVMVAETKGKKIVADIDETITLHGDELFLSQLVSLLLDNAVKYSTAEGDIRVSLQKKRKKSVFQVSNIAEDLPEGNLDILFERFYRSDASRNSETGGSGIGLSVAKAIVEAHKGSIHAGSSDGKTITFTVIL